jgi:excisionase family DNA binding protein
MASNKDGDALARLLSAEQVAEYLNVSRDLVYRIAQSGDIASIRIGTGTKTRVVFDPGDVQRYVDSRRSGMSAGHAPAIARVRSK